MLEENQRDHLDADVDAEQLERQVQREVDEVEAGVVGQREQHGRLVRQDVDDELRLAGQGRGRAQQPQDPGLDLADLARDQRGDLVGGEGAARAGQNAPHGVALWLGQWGADYNKKKITKKKKIPI